MRKRLYFLVPDVETCSNVFRDLQNQGVSQNKIYVIAREDIPLGELHKANALQKTELAHGVELGLGVGGFAGMLGGLLAVTFPPAGLVIGGGALVVLATALIGAGFGSMVSALVASDIPNQELAHFQNAISLDQILVIVDIPAHAQETITRLIKEHNPAAEIGVASPGETLGMETQNA